jgi:predicted nuclease with TOPRIM domain
MPWPRRTPAAVQLKRDNDALALQLVRLREQLRNKEHYASGLEVLLRERLARIDELHGKLEQLREHVKRLDAENDHLAAMMRQVAPPQLNAAMLAQKLDQA